MLDLIDGHFVETNFEELAQFILDVGTVCLWLSGGTGMIEAVSVETKKHVCPLKSSITTETQGEAPSATFLNKAEYIIGGMDADITGFGRMVINDEMIYAQQMPNGRFRILGCEMFAPKSTFAQNSGAGATDSVTSTLSVEATDVSPAPFYEGKLETDEGDISGLDGSVWTEVSL